MRYIVFVFIILLGTAAGPAPDLLGADQQNAALVPDFYKRYEGAINNTLKITLHLLKQDQAVSGYYYYQNKGIPLFLNGTMDSSGKVLLAETTRDGLQTGSFLVNALGGAEISGTWQSADKKKSLPFSAREEYGAYSAAFKAYELTRAAPLFEDSTAPTIDISLFYLYPVKYADPRVLAKLQLLLFAGKKGDPEKILQSISDGLVADYRQENRDIYNPDSEYEFMWQHTYGVSLMCNDKNFTTFRFYYYSYTGGAHGLFGDDFSSVDLETGKALTLDDIFVPGYKQEIGRLLDARVRQTDKIPADGSLEDYGYFTDNIMPGDTFYVAPDGIGFYYNIYEIRPYAYGSSDIFLSFKEIKQLIKPDSPVRRLFE
jgi:hypothetical protein